MLTFPSDQEQELYDWLRTSLPRYFFDGDTEEVWAAAITMLAKVRTQGGDWRAATYIKTARGIWLDQHARDLGTNRQNGELDEALQERLRNVPDALTHALLEDAAQAIVTGAGVSGTVQIMELRRDKAFLVMRGPDGDTGTGGAFEFDAATNIVSFEPTIGFAGGRPPYSSVEDALTRKIIISGAANAGNNGTFTITGMRGDAVLYTNATGVTRIDGTSNWRINRYDRRGNSITSGGGGPDGDCMAAYLSRGYRCGRNGSSFVMILPYGTTEGVRLSVLEMLRQRKAAGIFAVVERRLSP